MLFYVFVSVKNGKYKKALKYDKKSLKFDKKSLKKCIFQEKNTISQSQTDGIDF